MKSLYDDLCEKLRKDPRLTKKGGPRFDLSLLLFNARDDLRELWAAANNEISHATADGHHPSESMKAAVENLRPLFGERLD